MFIYCSTCTGSGVHSHPFEQNPPVAFSPSHLWYVYILQFYTYNKHLNFGIIILSYMYNHVGCDNEPMKAYYLCAIICNYLLHEQPVFSAGSLKHNMLVTTMMIRDTKQL